MKIDMHIHGEFSHDSEMTLSEIEEAAVKRGLDGVAICNHNVFKPIFSDKIIIIPSAEYSTDMGHILTYFLEQPIEEKLEKNQNGLFSAHEVIREAGAEGALCFLAHPFAPVKTRSDRFFHEIDGIEVINAKAHLSSKRDCSKQAAELCKRLNKPFCGGSDAHFPHEIGSAYTVFNTDSREDLKKCLEQKNVSAVLESEKPIKSAFERLLFNIKNHRGIKTAVIKLFYSVIVKAQLILGIRDKSVTYELKGE